MPETDDRPSYIHWTTEFCDDAQKCKVGDIFIDPDRPKISATLRGIPKREHEPIDYTTVDFEIQLKLMTFRLVWRQRSPVSGCLLWFWMRIS